MAGLSPKQERFVKEYLIDLNGTQAAIRAGYSAKTAQVQSSQLLSKLMISTRVKELQAERATKLELDADWVLRRLKDISDKCMQEVPVTEWDYEERCMVTTGEFQFDSQGANKATELIGKHLGMFKDKVEHSGDLIFTIKPPDDWNDS